MAGFFGLFGSKTKYVDEPETNEGSTAPSEDFFLSPDEAKSLGDLEYMRKPNTIRRTFPKTLSNKTTERIKQVSSLQETKVSGNQAQQSISQPKTTQPTQPAAATTPKPKVAQPTQPTAATTPKPEVAQPTQPTAASTERRSADSSMDMFRNMAREIRK